MDNLFKTRVLTTSVNELKTDVPMRLYDRFFRPREHMEDTSQIAFDVISGSEKLLKNIKVTDEAVITDQTGRRTITVEAPRLASKRVIHASYFENLRGYNQQIRTERVSDKIAREQADMKAQFDRTLEYWAAHALQGVIYDADLTTELVNYNVDVTHTPTLTSTDLWTHADSDPFQNFSDWKQLIEDDSYASIDSWLGICGKGAMDALVKNERVLAMLAETSTDALAKRMNVITMLDDIEIMKYTGSFIHTDGTRKRYIADDQFILIGICTDLVDTPYAPVLDMNVPGGIGNATAGGRGLMFFSKSWKVEDPSGRWLYIEGRPLPILKRPGAIIKATVI